MITRADIQGKIDEIRGDQTVPLSELTPLMMEWFKTKDLVMNNLTQEFMATHLATDLISYEGVLSSG